MIRNYKPTGRMLSRKTQEMACASARSFFVWARRALRRYRLVEPLWIETLKPRRLVETVRERELYTLDEVLAIARPIPGDGLKVQRDKAAVAFLFLSGMRSGAFVTLPVLAVDLKELTVKQWPELGVATKNSKAATTYLLDIPELIEIVRVWDAYVRATLPPQAMWYARLKYDPGADMVTADEATPPNPRRRGMMSKAVKDLCRSAGVLYRSPHKLRHGHAVYALKRARTIAEFKAVSQNLMHADLKITDGVYGILSGSDLQNTIAGLTSSHATDEEAVIDLLESLLTKMKQGR
jgi:integrase